MVEPRRRSCNHSSTEGRPDSAHGYPIFSRTMARVEARVYTHVYLLLAQPLLLARQQPAALCAARKRLVLGLAP